MRLGSVKTFDVVVLGGGPGGVTAALSAKNTYPEKSVLLVRREAKPMIPCGIPYIFHSLSGVDENVLPDKPLDAKGIERMLGEVKELKPGEIHMADGAVIKYEKLILATGSMPFVPPIPGVEKKNVWFVKKNAEYLAEMKEALSAVDEVVVIGGGFIGVELTDELLKAGKKVTIIEMLGWLLPTSMDEEFGREVEEGFRNRGARVLVSTRVKELTGGEKVEYVVLENGEKIGCGAVVVAAGYVPNYSLAESAGITVLDRVGVLVDEYLRTSAENVFAVGDCAVKRDFLTGRYYRLMLASTAAAQGRLAGSNLYDVKALKEFVGAVGTFSTKVGDRAFGATGLTEAAAKRENISYVVGTAEAVDRHPGKLPGASKMKVKLIFSRYSQVLVGAQVSGGNSVGELVNELAVMVQKRMTLLEIDTMQIGTHPLLTASPVAYPVVNAAANALRSLYG